MEIEILGHAASVMVVASLLMSNIKKLRIVNLIGSVLFIAYGLYIGSWPVVTMNTAAVLINSYHLIKIYRGKADTPEKVEAQL